MQRSSSQTYKSYSKSIQKLDKIKRTQKIISTFKENIIMIKNTTAESNKEKESTHERGIQQEDRNTEEKKPI